MATYEIVHDVNQVHRRKVSSVQQMVSITENTKGGVRILCHCNYEDAQWIVDALDLWKDFGNVGESR
jgi:hypothetical protein